VAAAATDEIINECNGEEEEEQQEETNWLFKY
jgi:hypothetical protein